MGTGFQVPSFWAKSPTWEGLSGLSESMPAVWEGKLRHREVKGLVQGTTVSRGRDRPGTQGPDA